MFWARFVFKSCAASLVSWELVPRLRRYRSAGSRDKRMGCARRRCSMKWQFGNEWSMHRTEFREDQEQELNAVLNVNDDIMDPWVGVEDKIRLGNV